MDTKIIEGLRAAVEAAYPDTPQNAATRTPLLAALRAEDFWNVRAPQLTDEVLILRRLEIIGRVVLRDGVLKDSEATLRDLLAEIDALRAKHAEGR